MKGSQAIVGRAQTVLVFGADDQAPAVVASLAVRPRRRPGRRRLVFSGRAVFDPKIVEHLSEVVLPCIDGIAERLVGPLRRQTLEVSIINLGAASAMGVGLSISGYSVDTAVFLAILSAILRVPLRQDTATTGHIASADGEVRPVHSIPAKIAAAIADPAVRRFVCPALDTDTSLKTLSPMHRERAADAMMAAKGEMQILPVTNVEELIRAATDDDALLHAGLRCGFFEAPARTENDGSPLDRAVLFMATGNDPRFWHALEGRLFAGEVHAARELLLVRCRHEIRRRRYPADFGRRLLSLLRSLPPTTRRSRDFFPLLPMDRCVHLARFATEADHPDLRYLFDAASGRISDADTDGSPTPPRAAATTPDAVSAVLAEMSPDWLGRRIGLPIDTARAGFVIDHVLIDSYDLFLDTVEAFYVALLRHSGSDRVCSDEETVRSRSIGLLENAFADQGGLRAAWAEARHGTRGGMRFVLDVLTERYKTEMQTDHVRRVVQEAIDPLDQQQRVAFMAALLEHLGPHLPPEFRGPPERFANHYAAVLQAYVQSLDRVKQLLRSL